MNRDTRIRWVVVGLAIMLVAGGCSHGKDASMSNQSAKDKPAPAAASTESAAGQAPEAHAAPQAPAGPTPTTPEQTKTTPSGLQYVDLVVGTGDSPAAGQTMVVHYTGWLTDGKKFDSSVDRGMPFQFPLGRRAVIAGWDEGVAGMKVGGKRKLIVPPELAYKDKGFPGLIPPNSTLVFEVELLGIR